MNTISTALKNMDLSNHQLVLNVPNANTIQNIWNYTGLSTNEETVDTTLYITPFSSPPPLVFHFVIPLSFCPSFYNHIYCIPPLLPTVYPPHGSVTFPIITLPMTTFAISNTSHDYFCHK